jgi:hypothetical protein
MKVIWADTALADYHHWQTVDVRIAKRIEQQVYRRWFPLTATMRFCDGYLTNIVARLVQITALSAEPT